MRIVLWNRATLAMAGFLCASLLHAQFTFDPQTYKDIEARLTVQVADRTVERGLGEATFTLTVTGPDTLEVEPPRLDDAAAAWKEDRLTNTRVVENQRATWSQVIRFKQSKKGIETLPDVSLRFRDQPGANWQEAKWVDILKHIRDSQASLAESAERTSWLRRWGFVLVLGGTAVLGLLVWLRKRGCLGREAPRPPDLWALREIERIEGSLMPPQGEAETYHTQISYVVRRYLAERFGLHALQQTTAEFLEAVQQVPQAAAEQPTLIQKGTTAEPRPRLTAEQRMLLSELFQRCDLAKFARASTPLEECRSTAELARKLVRQTTQ
jgi:hypothetical protein